jgi:LAO/AO transport system kinase
VTAPGLGDEVQALKAGLLEIADVLVVNKGDRDGADRAIADLTTMLGMASFPSRPGEPPRAAPALIRASAATGAGVSDIVAAIDALRAAPAAERGARRRRQVVRQVTALVGEQARAVARAAIGTEDAPGPLASTVDEVGCTETRSLERRRGTNAQVTAGRRSVTMGSCAD